ncbi:hypothetical protein [Kitasatospora sp. GAS204B]|uniref:hypothetical protein n=1 Tax=unclassified Kitasatospora TaxID=2633591 RepID=UPI0024767BF9|nr:hypothetical protein [Kitasatospora sp. GAS204B]MDH6119899.1 hypothetical protein [Kitasatospora sp. GAS204B]
MDESLPPLRRPVEPLTPEDPGTLGPADSVAQAPRFPLPKRHRRMLACAAVAASVALGTLGVGATVETVQHGTSVTAEAGAH